VVVNDFDAIDIQNNVFVAHGLCLFKFWGSSQMKPLHARVSFDLS
jgi:hypothetical protein